MRCAFAAATRSILRTRGLVATGVLTLCAMLLPGRVASAQKDVSVYWTHGATAGGELRYRLPGDDDTRRRGGLGSGERLTVQQGGQVCFQVEDANPLLYTYAAASQVVTVAQPEGLGDVIAGVQAVVAGLGVKSGPPATPARSGESATDELERLRRDSIQNANAWAATRAYSERVQSMLDTLKTLDDLELASDALPFDTVMVRARALQAGLAIARVAADRKRVDAEALLGKDDRVLVQLHALQDLASERFASRFKEFEDADARRSTPLCTTVDKDRVRLSLTTKSRGVEGAKLRRIVKDDVVAVELDPQSDKAFEVAPGVLLGPNVPLTKFSLANGIVKADPTSDVLARPALFALGRLWPYGWLWGGIGVAKGSFNTPDTFFGLVVRPGLSLAETQLSIGAGVGIFQVPDNLKEGAVGQPLPASVKNLDDNITSKARAGFAITVNISGLKLGQTPVK